jgi:hypothetical protein
MSFMEKQLPPAEHEPSLLLADEAVVANSNTQPSRLSKVLDVISTGGYSLLTPKPNTESTDRMPDRG